MTMTRGQFLRTLAIGAGGAASTLTALGSESNLASDTVANGSIPPSERNRRLAERLTKAAFTEAVKSKFRVLDRESPNVVEVELTEVHEGRSSEKHEQFSLLFKGPKEPALTQKTYAIEHGTMGDFDLFIVPVGVDDNGMSYEAVFNRLLT